MLNEEFDKERERPEEGADPAIGRFLQADSVVMPESLYALKPCAKGCNLGGF